MSAIPSGARVRVVADARPAVVSPTTGMLVTVPETVRRGLEGRALCRFTPSRRLASYVLVQFQTPGPWPAQLWLSSECLEEIAAEVVA